MSPQAKGFFKGMSFPLATTGVINSLFFGVYGAALKSLSSGKSGKEASSAQIFMAGCAGGAAQLVLACPTELVKIKMQIQTGELTCDQSVVFYVVNNGIMYITITELIDGR